MHAFALILVAAVTLVTAPAVQADGDLDKIVGPFTVSLAVAPATVGTRLRFRFRDTKTGETLAAPLVVRVSYRGDAREPIIPGPLVTTTTGLLDMTHVFGRPGQQDVLIEFQRRNDPVRYRPAAWSVDVPTAGYIGLDWTDVAWIGAAMVILAALAGGYACRRPRRSGTGPAPRDV